MKVGSAHFFFGMIFRKKEIETQVEALVTPSLVEKGYEVVAVDYLKSHEGMVLRLYVDRTGGVTSDELVQIHRWIEEKLQQEPISDLMFRQYQLEISSPGIDRIIKKKSDFERFVGSRIQIHLQNGLDGNWNQRNFTGILKEVKDGMIFLQVLEDIIQIPFDQIKSAHLRAESK